MRRQYHQDDYLHPMADINAQGSHDWRHLCEQVAASVDALSACFVFFHAHEPTPSVVAGSTWPLLPRWSPADYQAVWQQKKFYCAIAGPGSSLDESYLAVPILHEALNGLLLLKYPASPPALLPRQRQLLDTMAAHGALLWREHTRQLRTHKREGSSRRFLNRLKALFEHVPIPINAFNAQGRCILWNNECERLFGWSFTEIREHPAPISLFYPDPAEQQQVMATLSTHNNSVFREWRPTNRAGKKLTTLWANIMLPNGDMLSVGHDVSEQKEIANQQRLAASVFGASYDGIMITDPDHRIIHINPAFTRITGYSSAEVLGRTPKVLQYFHFDDDFYNQLHQHFKTENHWQGELSSLRKNGESYSLLLAISVVKDDEGRVLNHVAIFSDISYLKDHEAELEHRACHDALTGVPNRVLFGELLEHAIASAQRNYGRLAVCYLDLDGFKAINDGLGHAAGDRLLIEISRRLGKVTRSCDAMCRLGGDEFALLFTELHNSLECDEILERVQSVVNEPLELDGHSVRISASIGVALYPQDSLDAELLLRYADQAMYQAKKQGKNAYVFFDAALHLQEQNRLQQLTRLINAFRQGEFLLYYQPTTDLFTQQVVGMEALLRWNDPEHGIVTPEGFLPVIVGSHMEFELGMWVIEQVLAQMTQWSQQGLVFKVSFNVSGGQLLHPDFSKELNRLLALYPQALPSLLALEFQENAVLTDIKAAVAVLERCRSLGICVSMDNFGTGYSSLSHLKRLPLDSIKIDRSFVCNLLSNTHDACMIEVVVQLAATLRMVVVVEGMERFEQGERLKELGCYYVQGYGISRPMPAEQVGSWLQEWNDKYLPH